MKRNTVWLVVGGVALAGAAFWLWKGSQKRRRRDDVMASSRVADVADMGPVPVVESPKSAGQTLAESLGVILRRRTDKQPKQPKEKDKKTSKSLA
jgi:hypothetical protein